MKSTSICVQDKKAQPQRYRSNMFRWKKKKHTNRTTAFFFSKEPWFIVFLSPVIERLSLLAYFSCNFLASSSFSGSIPVCSHTKKKCKPHLWNGLNFTRPNTCCSWKHFTFTGCNKHTQGQNSKRPQVNHNIEHFDLPLPWGPSHRAHCLQSRWRNWTEKS